MASNVGTILVTTEELTAAAATLSTQLTKVQNCFEKMNATMSASASYWVGIAGDAHRKLYTDQKSAIAEILARYQEHISDLNEMAGVYSAAERDTEAQAEGLPELTL
jgi:WXG100 family type VII secretion target